MAYFRPSIDAEGIHIPTYNDILEELTNNYKSIFGDDVYLGTDSKDYQMISIFAKAMDDFLALAVDAYNARSPQYATGDSLDVLCTIVGIYRRASTYAETVVNVTGTEGTVIPAGSKVADTDGNLWSTKESCTIASGGSTVTVVRDDPGMVELVPGYINLVYDTIVGWDGVRNTETVTSGMDTETDEELRVRLRYSLVEKASTVDIAIESAIGSIAGVESSKLYVNDSDTTDEHNIPSHSICMVAIGGETDEIVQKIYDNKAPGIGTYGNTSGTAYDSAGRGKTISFERPTVTNYAPKVDGIVYNDKVDIPALRSQIQQIVFEWGNTLGIGESCILSKAYPEIYSSIQSSGIAITRIYVEDENHVKHDIVDCDWNAILKIDDVSDIDVSGIDEPSP